MSVFFTKKGAVFLILVFGLFLFLILLISRLFQTDSQSIGEPPTPTSVQENMQLSEKEKSYPEAPFQPLPSINDRVGILIVESDLPDIRIVLDPPNEEGPPSSTDQRILIIGRFKMTTIPVGPHALTASSPGYSLSSRTFTIEPNKITRLKIDLTPLPTDGAYYPLN